MRREDQRERERHADRERAGGFALGLRPRRQREADPVGGVAGGQSHPHRLRSRLHPYLGAGTEGFHEPALDLREDRQVGRERPGRRVARAVAVPTRPETRAGAVTLDERSGPAPSRPGPRIIDPDPARQPPAPKPDGSRSSAATIRTRYCRDSRCSDSRRSSGPTFSRALRSDCSWTIRFSAKCRTCSAARSSPEQQDRRHHGDGQRTDQHEREAPEE